jgi:hypothetical protein
MDDTDGFTCVRMTRITFRDFQGTFDLIDIITYALASQSQKVWIINYPLFIYGDLSIYDDNNHEIYKAVIDGDDYIVLDISNYPIGKYRIPLISTKRELKETYNLELEIY